MNPFNRRAALRIALVSILLAAVASPLAWFVARKNAEEDTVALAMEESRRVLSHASSTRLRGPDAGDHARKAADALAGGLFDIAEIYGPQGDLLAEAMTEGGAAVESRLPGHHRPVYSAASFQRFRLDGLGWILRVFVPLHDPAGPDPAQISGYFEGVRIVPAWQRAQMRERALNAALMVGLASLLCGLVIYPVVVHLSADNERKTREVLVSHLSLLEVLGRAIAKRDTDTGAHNLRVAWIAARIGERLGLSGWAMQSLIAGSFLHDVGKVSIPDQILRKPGRLDDGELAIMRTHVAHGQDILRGIDWLEAANAVVAGHHEKWDGSGYPQQAAGDAIPLSARIFAVADVFDALCSRRPYKAPMDFDAAMALLERDSGSHFDPLVMAAFRPIAREVFDRLAGISEADARGLLAERVRRHFGI